MKVITCASYYGCGSSAVTDLISEFSGVESLGDYEFRFLHDIDGISDLEHHLIECPNRHNSGHALKRFESLSKFNSGRWFNQRYEPFFNGQYLKLTNEYIDKLTCFKFKGQWFYDFYDRGCFLYYVILLINKVLDKLNVFSWRILSDELTYGTTIDRQYFLKCTQEYLHSLLDAANISKSEYLMIDQLMPSSNIERCLRYVPENVFVFVVDRDPRDLYIMGKYVWLNDKVMPVDDVVTFCKWFSFTRGCTQEKDNKENIMFVKFEDLIYRYEETKAKIISLIGLSIDNHISPFVKFNPRRSVVNTRTWTKYPNELSNIQYIEKELKEYLFDYNSVTTDIIVGIDTNDKTNF